ncbi:cytochrome P450 [Pluteus cervinus]|uniref:Cytochrome P450 n=1 Tax=Pluteus cervinus TaxID=181527 RepID=A0ACD3AEC3_9AGAR|nr:cytochrome P450 [Pluteus cervinus]
MILIVLFIGFLLTILAIFSRRPDRRYALPGPKGVPLLGNILQIPPFQFLRFIEWKAQFGPIFLLKLAGQPVVVINSIEVAGDLLERRSGIYSDRPRFIVASELLTGGLVLPVVRYGDLWRKLRRAAHDGLRSQTMPGYELAQELEAAILMESLIKDSTSNSWAEEVKRSTASSMKTAVYGTPPITSINDPVVSYINAIGHRVTLAMVPGRYLVEFFPKMLLLPGWLAPWKREALSWFKRDSEKLRSLMESVEQQVINGLQIPSFATNLYLTRGRHQLNRIEQAWLAGTLFTAGSDTSSSTFTFFILAMRLYPEVMKKAQAEIDRVVGRERAPNFADRDKLPYIRALIKEVLRWGPVTPLGVPRQAQQDDYYNGHFIPKGSIVVVNAWGINNDPKVFPNPHEFRPERFLDPSGTADVIPEGTRNQGHVSFGFGRRICIGMNLAVQFQFINIATLLWAANVEPGYDKDGDVATPSNSPSNWVDEGAVIRPVPFPCNIVPRFSGVEEVLRRTRAGRSI